MDKIKLIVNNYTPDNTLNDLSSPLPDNDPDIIINKKYDTDIMWKIITVISIIIIIFIITHLILFLFLKIE